MPLVYQLDTWRAVLKVHVGLVLYNRIFPKTRYPVDILSNTKYMYFNYTFVS